MIIRYLFTLMVVYLIGLSCGSYTTNSATTLKYICEHAPLDLLVIQDRQLLDKLIQDEFKELMHIVQTEAREFQ